MSSLDDGTPGADEVARILEALPELGGPSALFDSREARNFSSYSGPPRLEQGESKKGPQTLHLIPEGRLWPEDKDPGIHPLGETVHDMLRAHVLNEHFACIGAKSAFSNNTYRFGFYKQMGHLSSVAAMGRDLRRFVGEYKQIGQFTTFVAAFKYPQLTTEDEFEKVLWEHLQLMHNHDSAPPDPHYSIEPGTGHFAFSFAGEAFFIVGMHTGASRFNRKMIVPLLVFNPESQIRRLKENGILERFAGKVRDNDTLYQGNWNPSLPTDPNSTGGEERVYSGKRHDGTDGWKCPFHPRPELVKK